MLARRAGIKLLHTGIDITSYIQKDLISFRYTDNASKNADDIEIHLKNEDGKWFNDWYMEKGDLIQAEINTFNWKHEGDNQILPCGRFIVDEPECDGYPNTMTIKAISIPSNTNFTGTKKSRLWEGIRLSMIANDIAYNAGLEIFFDSSIDPYYEQQSQDDTSDMAFLSKLCEDEGLSFKVTDKKIVIFNEYEYEQRPSIAVLDRNSSIIKSYNLKSSLSNTAYAGCRVKYYDSNSGRTIDYLFSLNDDIDLSKDKIYEINNIKFKISSVEEAKRLCRKKLRELNKKESSGSITVLGNILFLGGSCIDLKNFGKFDGKYFIDKSVHNLPEYQVNIEFHKTLQGY